MPSTIKTDAGLDRCRSQLASNWNEWGVTRVWPGSVDPSSLSGLVRPFFYHTVIAGLGLPFSSFMAMLEHCALHFQPNSVTTLAISSRAGARCSWG
jgi:hypothetical protein